MVRFFFSQNVFAVQSVAITSRDDKLIINFIFAGSLISNDLSGEDLAADEHYIDL